LSYLFSDTDFWSGSQKSPCAITVQKSMMFLPGVVIERASSSKPDVVDVPLVDDRHAILPIAKADRES